MRRPVAAGAAKAELGGQNVIAAEIIAVLETIAHQLEWHAVSPAQAQLPSLAPSALAWEPGAGQAGCNCTPADHEDNRWLTSPITSSNTTAAGPTRSTTCSRKLSPPTRQRSRRHIASPPSSASAASPSRSSGRTPTASGIAKSQAA